MNRRRRLLLVGASRFDPSRVAGLSVWLDPNASSVLFSDQSGTTPATTVVRKIASRSGSGYASGNPATAEAAQIDTLSYPGATALYFGGGVAPFTTVSGVGGTGQSFTLAMDYLTISTNGDQSSGGLASSAIGVYESWNGSRYLSIVNRATFATIVAASSLYWVGRRRLIIRGTASSLTFRINGADFAQSALTSAAHTGGVIGAAAPANLSKQMVLREYLQWNRALTDAECSALDGYFVARQTPVPLPLSLPLVVCDGNSIVAGFTVTVEDAWPTRLEALLGRGSVRAMNLGAIAFQTPTLVTQAATFVDVLYSASRAKNIVCVMEGTNHLIASATGAQAYASFQTYCLARRAAGWSVVVANVPPSTLITSGKETARTDCNASLASNWNTFADGFVDLTTGNLSDPLNATYYTDGTHWTAAGQADAAARFQTAVSGLLA